MNTISIFFTVLSYSVIASTCLSPTDTFYTGKPIKILKPLREGSFESNLNALNEILDSAAFKDRDLVVVSVTGAFRPGESFLINFFLRYLQAQVAEVLLAGTSMYS